VNTRQRGISEVCKGRESSRFGFLNECVPHGGQVQRESLMIAGHAGETVDREAVVRQHRPGATIHAVLSKEIE